MHIILTIEIAIISLAFLSFFSMLVASAPTPAPLILVGMAALLLFTLFAFFPFRWQIIPAAFVIIILLTGLVLNWEPGRVISIIGYGVGTLSLLLSLALSIGFPVRALPVPDGPNEVGVRSLIRNYIPHSKSTESDLSERRLLLKIWYPATIDPKESLTRDTLWSEFNNPDHSPPFERIFTHYLKSMTTSSFKNAPLAQTVEKHQVIIYNHALLSNASENSLLMEALASHGYIIISVQHRDQRSEYARLQKSRKPEERTREVADLKKLGMATHLPRAERSALALQVYSKNITLTEIVKRRAADSRYVLDHTAQLLSALANETSEIRFDHNKIALVGLSLGGAVATELCKTDKRCSAVVNMDGGIFGTHVDAPATAPYLMLYSERNEGGNDFLKEVSDSSFEDHTIAGSDHFNFHDASVVLPGLKWIGLMGPVEGGKMVEERNQRIKNYLDRIYQSSSSSD